jgi:hypothetical protein
MSFIFVVSLGPRNLPHLYGLFQPIEERGWLEKRDRIEIDERPRLS